MTEEQLTQLFVLPHRPIPWDPIPWMKLTRDQAAKIGKLQESLRVSQEAFAREGMRRTEEFNRQRTRAITSTIKSLG